MNRIEIIDVPNYLVGQECRGCGNESKKCCCMGKNIRIPFCGKPECQRKVEEEANRMAECLQKDKDNEPSKIFQRFAGRMKELCAQ